MLGHLTRRPRQRGLSLVELMVGLALGLFIAGIATTLLLGRLREQRALLVEIRLMQDLRTSADIVARDLRRAGFWADASAAVWQPSTALAANPYTALTPDTGTADSVSFRFSRDEVENNMVDNDEQFGFRVRNGVLQMLIGAGGWQALTDDTTMVVTAFRVTPEVQDIALDALCEQPCPLSAPACGPHQFVRRLTVSITGHASTDVSVVRSTRSTVRLRNDAVIGRCPV